MDEHIIQVRQQDFEVMAESSTETIFTLFGRVVSTTEDDVTLEVGGSTVTVPIAAVVDYDSEPYATRK